MDLQFNFRNFILPSLKSDPDAEIFYKTTNLYITQTSVL